MDDVKSGLRSPLGRVRGLGSAKYGTEHWWAARLSSLALIPLSLYVMYGLFEAVVFDPRYLSAYNWVQNPLNGAALLLYLVIGLQHTAQGLQVVIEDYVHAEGKKLLSLMLVNTVCSLLGLAGVLAIFKIMFGA